MALAQLCTKLQRMINNHGHGSGQWWQWIEHRELNAASPTMRICNNAQMLEPHSPWPTKPHDQSLKPCRGDHLLGWALFATCACIYNTRAAHAGYDVLAPPIYLVDVVQAKGATSGRFMNKGDVLATLCYMLIALKPITGARRLGKHWQGCTTAHWNA